MSHSSKAEMSPPCLNQKLGEASFGLGDDEQTRFKACRGVDGSAVRTPHGSFGSDGAGDRCATDISTAGEILGARWRSVDP